MFGDEALGLGHFGFDPQCGSQQLEDGDRYSDECDAANQNISQLPVNS
jgi:hypothetical protein